MKNILLIIFGVILIASCTNSNKNGYKVTGKISGKVPAQALLQIYEDGEMKALDSASFVNGKFEFTGTVDSPDYYYIQIGTPKNKIALFIENSEITIKANIDSLRSAEIFGSNTQNEYDAFNESKSEFDNQQKVLYAEYKKAETDELKKVIENRYDSIDSEKSEHIKKYILNNSSSVLAPYIIRRELIHSIDLKELTELTNTISPELKDNKYTKELHQRIEILRSLEPGMPAPEFTQNDTAGNPVNLSDFKGKYLLIDFWASWCVPCRKANPTVVAMYNKYNTKGFTILGVSMDDNKDKWLEAIEADGLVWSQVSVLKGWNNPVGKKYGVNSIPHAILIDPDGNIVKRGIHAGELDELLGSLMK